MARAGSVQVNGDILAQETTRNNSQDANTCVLGTEEDNQGDRSTHELRRNTKCSPLP